MIIILFIFMSYDYVLQILNFQHSFKFCFVIFLLLAVIIGKTVLESFYIFMIYSMINLIDSLLYHL